MLLQEDKISDVLVNKDIISTPAGDAGITLSKNVLALTASPATGNMVFALILSLWQCMVKLFIL